jgi:hypothetical protein
MTLNVRERPHVMRITKNTLQFALPGLLLFMAASADTLSFKFQDTADTPFGPEVVAGAGSFASLNWNLLQQASSADAANDALFTSGIVNSDGEVTTVLEDITDGGNTDPVHYVSANTWRSGAGNGSPDATLMNGYLDDGGNDQPAATFSLKEGVMPTYTVVVYVYGDVPNSAVGRYWVEEWTDPLTEGTPITDRVGISSNSFSGAFVQAGSNFRGTDTPMDVTVASGNYLVFTNLTARNFRVRAAGNGDPEDFGRGPLNAIQIFEDATNPDADDDGDGLLNGWEIFYGLNPDSGVGADGADGNPDGDGLTNVQEQTKGTNPKLQDTDGDRLNDEIETNTMVWGSDADRGTDPLNRDSDGDGLDDGAENNSGSFVDLTMTGTDPNKADTDGDGLADLWEIDNQFDPIDDGSTDPENGAAGNPDMDFSPNLREFTQATNPRLNDTDNDTLLDGYEDNGGIWVSATMTGSDPLSGDTDGDSIPDAAETGDGNYVDGNATGTDPSLHDTDGDGYFDEQEIAQGTDPSDVVNKPAFPTHLGFWTFDDQGVTTTADLSPNGNDGTLLGGTVYVAGHTGSAGDFAVELDGIEGAVTTTMTLNDIGAFTMAGWIKMTVAQTNRSGLFGQNDILEFGFSEPGNVHLWSNPGGAINTTLEPSEEWVHIAFVGDTTGRTIYINGVESVRGVAGTPLAASGFSFNIGGGGVFDATGNFFQGQIDDVGVWEVSMSPQLIKGLADGTISPVPGLSAGLAISSLARTDNSLAFTIQGTIPGVDYIIEESSTLTDDWTEATDFVGADGVGITIVNLSLGASPLPKRFYRARILEE